MLPDYSGRWEQLLKDDAAATFIIQLGKVII